MTSTILSDLSTPSLARSIKENLYEFFHFMGSSPTCEMEEGPGWMRWRTPIGHPWFNGVLCRRPPAEDDDAFIQHSLAYFRQHGTPAITWWLGPDQPPSEWAPYLQAQGFRFEDSTPGMALSLDILPPEGRLPPGLEITVVEDEATLVPWMDVFVQGYPIPVEMKEFFRSLMVGMGLSLPIRNYLGYLDGVPVATSNLYLGAGVAGVMFVATLPEARGRGVGAAMTLAPLLEARRLGYHAGILQSSEMGYSVYRRLGFQHLCAIEHFYWTP